MGGGNGMRPVRPVRVKVVAASVMLPTVEYGWPLNAKCGHGNGTQQLRLFVRKGWKFDCVDLHRGCVLGKEVITIGVGFPNSW